MQLINKLESYLKKIIIFYMVYIIFETIQVLFSITTRLIYNSSYTTIQEYIHHFLSYICGVIIFIPVILIIKSMIYSITKHEGGSQTSNGFTSNPKVDEDNKNTYSFFIKSVRFILILTIIYLLSQTLYNLYNFLPLAGLGDYDIYSILSYFLFFYFKDIVTAIFIIILIILFISSFKFNKKEKINVNMDRYSIHNNYYASNEQYEFTNTDYNSTDSNKINFQMYEDDSEEIKINNMQLKIKPNVVFCIATTVLMVIYIITSSKSYFYFDYLPFSYQFLFLLESSMPLLLLISSQIIVAFKFIFEILKKKSHSNIFINKRRECNFYIITNICIIIYTTIIITNYFQFSYIVIDNYLLLIILTSTLAIIYNTVYKVKKL